MKKLREMQSDDISQVIAIIESHDEDDAEAAEAGYQVTGGTYDNYVYEVDGEIIGVTGFFGFLLDASRLTGYHGLTLMTSMSTKVMAEKY